MSDVPNYAPQDILSRIKAALAGLIPGGLPDPGVGPPLRGRPVSSGNVSDGFFGGGDNVIPPSRPDMTLGDPSFDLVSRIIQEVKNEATKKPSARTRGPQGGRGGALPAKVPPSKVSAGTRSVPIPVNPRGATDIAQTVLPPAPPVRGAGLLSVPSSLTQSPSAGIVPPPTAGPPSIPGAGPQLSPEEIAKLLFTPPPAGSTAAAPSVNGPPMPPGGSIPMGVSHPPQTMPPPTLRPDAGPQPSAGLPPASPPIASPMVAPPPIDPRAAGQGTLGPEFLASMPPQMIAALLGLGRGRQ